MAAGLKDVSRRRPGWTRCNRCCPPRGAAHRGSRPPARFPDPPRDRHWAIREPRAVRTRRWSASLARRSHGMSAFQDVW